MNKKYKVSFLIDGRNLKQVVFAEEESRANQQIELEYPGAIILKTEEV